MPNINFEVTEEEKALFDAVAAAEHMKATQWVRSVALRVANQHSTAQVNKRLIEMFESPFFQAMLTGDPMAMFGDSMNEIGESMEDLVSMMDSFKDDEKEEGTK